MQYDTIFYSRLKKIAIYSERPSCGPINHHLKDRRSLLMASTDRAFLSRSNPRLIQRNHDRGFLRQDRGQGSIYNNLRVALDKRSQGRAESHASRYL